MAGIVVFHPEQARLLDLIEAVAPEVGGVTLFMNSGIAPDLRASIDRRGDVTLIGSETNLGIGAALNALAEAAADRGFEAVILFDQDSQPPPGLVTRLVAAQETLIESGETPAVVAPRMVAARSGSKAPTYRFRTRTTNAGRVRAVEFVPTSGSLIRIAALRRLGAFRADFFIDGIDIEWSFRAWAAGLSCWVALDAAMPHSVGDGVIAWPALGFTMPRQRPFRMYCTVRNTVYGLRLRHIRPSWKARQCAYLPLQMFAYAAHHRWAPGILLGLAAGLVDGLSGRLGPPREISGTPTGG